MVLVQCPSIAPGDWGNDPAQVIADHFLTYHSEAASDAGYLKLATPLWNHYAALCQDASEATNTDADYIDLRVEDMLTEAAENLRANKMTLGYGAELTEGD